MVVLGGGLFLMSEVPPHFYKILHRNSHNLENHLQLHSQLQPAHCRLQMQGMV